MIKIGFIKKARVFTILLIIIVIAFVLPIIDGFFIKGRVKAAVAALQAIHQHISLVDYSQGLYHSEAKLKLTDKQNTLEVDVNINHGPYLFLQPSTTYSPILGLASASFIVKSIGKTANKLKKFLDNQKNILRGSAALDFMGEIQSNYRLSSISFSNKAGVVINWPGFTGKSNFDFASGRITNQLTISPLAFADKQYSWEIGKSQLLSIMSKTKNNFWENSTTYTVNKIVAKLRNDAYLSFNNLKLIATSTHSKTNKVNYNNDLSIRSLIIEGTEYKSIKIDTDIININAALFKKMLAVNTKKNKQPYSILNNFAEGLVLVNNGAKLDNSIRIGTDYGSVMSKLAIYQGPKTIAKASATLKQIHATWQLKLPKEIAQKMLTTFLLSNTDASKNFLTENSKYFQQGSLNNQIDNFLQQQKNQAYITDNGKQYVMNFALQNGQYTVNGKPLDFELLTR